MTLYDLLYLINDNCIIHLWNTSQELIGKSDGKDNLPEYLNDCIVYDIFTDIENNIPIICIEIETECEL